ncbi:hypothetical protein [Sedimenticola selenatireducens]|uniref:hypothetical protein n=1 Tax=Sedimenticola selenatireducens TaxID=191960 RepID=UPI00049065B7|nr:hypothetical protein [Sedimenticola selenatireducens]
MSATLPIYLDDSATTPAAPEVANATLPFPRDQFGDPWATHPNGRVAVGAAIAMRDEGAAQRGLQAAESAAWSRVP